MINRIRILFLLFLGVPVTLACAFSTGDLTATPAFTDTPVALAPTGLPTGEEAIETQTFEASTPSPPTSVQILPDPNNFQWELVARDFQRPLGLTHAGDERLFVLEQRGRI